jgi:hypothetical protein
MNNNTPYLCTYILIALLFAIGCTPKVQRNDPSVWKKIKLDFRNIDNNGFAGPADGKVSVHYEFCIPQTIKYWKQVQKIDSTAQLLSGSKGRIGCSNAEWLIIGHTDQPQYRRVLYDLAALPYINTIQEVFWE